MRRCIACMHCHLHIGIDLAVQICDCLCGHKDRSRLQCTHSPEAAICSLSFSERRRRTLLAPEQEPTGTQAYTDMQLQVCRSPCQQLALQAWSGTRQQHRRLASRPRASAETQANNSQAELFSKLSEVCTEMRQAPPSVVSVTHVQIHTPM